MKRIKLVYDMNPPWPLFKYAQGQLDIIYPWLKYSRESSSLLNKIKKGKQQDHPDNGLKSIRFTGPGQDFGNAATAASKVYIMIS